MSVSLEWLADFLAQKLQYQAMPYNEWRKLSGQTHPAVGRLYFKMTHGFREPILAKCYGEYVGFRLTNGHEMTDDLGMTKKMTVVRYDSERKRVFSEGYERMYDQNQEWELSGEYVNGYPWGQVEIRCNGKLAFQGEIVPRIDTEKKKMVFLLERYSPLVDDLKSQIEDLKMD